MIDCNNLTRSNWLKLIETGDSSGEVRLDELFRYRGAKKTKFKRNKDFYINRLNLMNCSFIHKCGSIFDLKKIDKKGYLYLLFGLLDLRANHLFVEFAEYLLFYLGLVDHYTENGKQSFKPYEEKGELNYFIPWREDNAKCACFKEINSGYKVINCNQNEKGAIYIPKFRELDLERRDNDRGWAYLILDCIKYFKLKENNGIKISIK